MTRLFRSNHRRRASALLPLGLGFSLLGVAIQTRALAQGVDLPRPGVVCDGPRQICFDRQGPSLAITRQYYGQAAANQLLAQLSGRPPQREFMLSGGQLCDLSQGACWDDGWRRRRVNPMLSRHLFGAAPTLGQGPGSNPKPWPQPNPNNRQCQLSQRGLPVFNGACRLSRQGEGNAQIYRVEMGSGQRYTMQRRGNLLVLNDATGTWPVFLFDRGNSVQFRWANLLLDVSRPMQARSGGAEGMAPASPTPRSTGESRQDLIDGLFQ